MIRNSASFKVLMKLLFPKKNEKPVYKTLIVRITCEAYKKLNLYAKIVSEIAGEDIECCGNMLNYASRNDGVIRDVYLDYQTVKADKVVDISSESDYMDYAQRLGMSQSGMWHSHGRHIPCHSDGDDKCIKWCHTNNKIRKDCMIKNDHDAVFYTPSIVVNKDEYVHDGLGKSYYTEFLVGNGKDRDVKVKNAKLEMIKENNNILPTLEEIVLEVGEKVKYKKFIRRVKLKHLSRYKSVLEKYKKPQINIGQRRVLSRDVLNYITIGEVRK